jgi:predicted MFS family arabinose efflux permease
MMSNNGEFARGWPVVLTAFCGVALGIGAVPIYTIGIFAHHFVDEFHWKYSEIMFGITIMWLVVVVGSSAVGYLTDRFGVRRVTLISVFLFSIAIASFALSTGSRVVYYLNWLAMSVLGLGTNFLTWTRVVNFWFQVNRGLALGLVMAGAGMFGALGKPLVMWIIAAAGWRSGYLALAGLSLAIVLPLAWFFVREPPRAPDAARRSTPTAVPLGAALRGRRFWVLGVFTFLVTTSVAGFVPHLETVLTQAGFADPQQRSLLPALGLSVIAGRVVGGWLLDIVWAPAVAFVLLAFCSVGWWLLSSGSHPHYAVALLAIGMIGAAGGVELDVLSYCTARYFGLKSYSTIFGALFGFLAAGAAVGPVLLGYVFDLTGSYSSALRASAVAVMIGAGLLMTLGRYPILEDTAATAVGHAAVD